MSYSNEYEEICKKENVQDLALEYVSGDCITYEVYYSPVTKKEYEIDLVLDDARKWNTIKETE